MKSIGYKYRIESQHVERDHPTAWWWRDMKLFDRVKERIEGKGFAFTQVTSKRCNNGDNNNPILDAPRNI